MLIKFLFTEIKYNLCNDTNTFENKTFENYYRIIFYLFFTKYVKNKNYNRIIGFIILLKMFSKTNFEDIILKSLDL